MYQFQSLKYILIVRKTFENNVKIKLNCSGYNVHISLSKIVFYPFFSDSAADTSLVDDCPDPYATEITTVAPSTKGKPKKKWYQWENFGILYMS